VSANLTELSADLERLGELARARAAQLLSSGEVRLVIGHGPAWFGPLGVPHFAAQAAAAGKFVAGPHCVAGLAKYVLEEQGREGKVAVLARGCDILGLKRLVADRRIDAGRLMVLGLPCAGAVDLDKLAAAARVPAAEIAEIQLSGDSLRLRLAGGEGLSSGPALEDVLAGPCLACEFKVPADCDEVLGSSLLALGAWAARPPAKTQEDLEADVAALEGKAPEERYAFWAAQFDRCLRCYACRNACPACNCRVCALESYDPKWLGHPTDGSNQFMFHFIRAMDVAGRCVACGECERVCPVGLPLMQLSRKMTRDIRTLFAIARPHVPGELEPLGGYRPDDPEEFM
jgi:ferredoxin